MPHLHLKRSPGKFFGRIAQKSSRGKKAPAVTHPFSTTAFLCRFSPLPAAVQAAFQNKQRFVIP
jgi:hypothetical protein